MRMMFVIGHLGDYHVPRYEALKKLVERRGDEIFLVEIFGRSGVYAFPQLTRDAFFGKEPARAVTLEPDITDAGGRWPSVAYKLAGIARTLRPDVVVTLGYHTPYSLWLYLIRRTAGTFRIIYMSDSKLDDGVRRRFKERLKRSLVCRFDGALVAGERHRAYAQTLGIPLERSRVGFDVIDVERFARLADNARASESETRRRYALPRRYVLCVSRFVPRKNVDVVVDAYALTGLADRGISLVLVGHGPDMRAIEGRVSSMQLDKNVRFLDPIPNAQMPAVYALCDFMVLGSEFDQWGLCVNEAFAASKTAIVTQTCGAADELVKDSVNGFVVEPGNADALAEKMQMLALNDVLRDALSKRARQTVDKWSPSMFAANLMELADRLLCSERRVLISAKR
ncbi:glycosyltransferase family 4 protein [Paraburkholderia phymatum]|uniref:Glycosyltransferase family 4 protein n=1 Tax=Paraburkholderia phymatum TaxID=148447 RepID=A0ACC6U3P8_9BURK